MRFKLVILTLMIMWPSFMIAGCNDPVPDSGLVQNPGFESGSGSWHLKKVTRLVTSDAHSGKYSLQYTNTDSKKYSLVTQSIAVKPGQKLYFSAWIKGKDITTKELWADKGAGIYVQGYDSKGKYSKGAFPFCLTGTFDWQQIKGVYVVPENVTRITLGLYMRRQTTGTAWFDDISVKVVDPPVFEAFLQYPNYRGITTVNNNHPWQILFTSSIPSDRGPTILKSSILDGKNKQLFSKEYQLSSQQPAITISWSPKQNLKAGKYLWRLELMSANEKHNLKKEIPVRVVQKMPEVYVDQEGFTVVDGKRFFPLGLYLGKGPKQGNWASSNENLRRISSAGFNTILSYYYGDRKDASDYLKQAGNYGLYVIYNLADMYDGSRNYTRLKRPALQTATTFISQLKNNANLLAWYTGDELGTGKLFSAEKMYQQTVQLDPAHPVYQVNNDPEILHLFYNSVDIFGTDPYPVSGDRFNSLVQVSSWTHKTRQSSQEIKPVWEVVQIFDKMYAKSNLPSHPPTLDEMRNMSYQALINGAKGIIYYAYHWLWYGRDKKGKKIFSPKDFQKRWPEVQAMAKEIKTVIPVILYDRPVELQAISSSPVQYQGWEDSQKLTLLIANPDTREETLSLRIPSGWRPEKYLPKKMAMNFQNQTLTLHLSPLASGKLIFTK